MTVCHIAKNTRFIINIVQQRRVENKMLNYEKLSHGLYDAVSQALRLIEQEQQHCEEACMQSGTPDYRALYFHLLRSPKRCAAGCPK